MRLLTPSLWAAGIFAGGIWFLYLWPILSPEAWSAIATIALVFATIALVGMAFVQDHTSRAELRPYVFMESSTIEKVTVPEWPEAEIVLKNFGKTPAAPSTSVAID